MIAKMNEEDSDTDSDNDFSDIDPMESLPDGKNAESRTGSLSLSDSDCDHDDQCPICLGQFEGQNLGNPQNCQHVFCLRCIEEWTKNVNSCPVDRKKFNCILVRQSKYGPITEEIYVADKEVKEEDLEMPPTFCRVCDECDREETMLLCDRCDDGYHLECLTPPLQGVPIEDWYCRNCVRTSGNEDMLQVIFDRVEPVLHHILGLSSRSRPRTAAARRSSSSRRRSRNSRRRNRKSKVRARSVSSKVIYHRKLKRQTDAMRSLSAYSGQKSVSKLPFTHSASRASARASMKREYINNRPSAEIRSLSLFGDPFDLSAFHEADADDNHVHKEDKSDIKSSSKMDNVGSLVATDILGDILQGYQTLDPSRVSIRRDGTIMPVSFENNDEKSKPCAIAQDSKELCTNILKRYNPAVQESKFEDADAYPSHAKGKRRRIRFADDVGIRSPASQVSSCERTDPPAAASSSLFSHACSQGSEFAKNVRFNTNSAVLLPNLKSTDTQNPASSGYLDLAKRRREEHAAIENLLDKERAKVIRTENSPGTSLTLNFKIPKKRAQVAQNSSLTSDSYMTTEAQDSCVIDQTRWASSLKSVPKARAKANISDGVGSSTVGRLSAAKSFTSAEVLEKKIEVNCKSTANSSSTSDFVMSSECSGKYMNNLAADAGAPKHTIGLALPSLNFPDGERGTLNPRFTDLTKQILPALTGGSSVCSVINRVIGQGLSEPLQVAASGCLALDHHWANSDTSKESQLAISSKDVCSLQKTEPTLREPCNALSLRPPKAASTSSVTPCLTRVNSSVNSCVSTRHQNVDHDDANEQLTFGLRGRLTRHQDSNEPAVKEKDKRMMNGINRLTRINLIADKVKKALKPYYKKSLIDKEDYKHVMRSAVNLLKCREGDVSEYFVLRLVEEIIKQRHREQSLNPLAETRSSFGI